VVHGEQLARRSVFIEEAAGSASSQYTFLHDLYQQALYDRLSTSRRARLHRRIAEVEVQAPADQVRERAAQLAVHSERAGDPARAIEHLQQAATNALKRQAFQEAIDLLQHALALLASLPRSNARDESELGVQMQFSQPLLMTKGYGAPEVAAVMARARELIQPLPPSPALLPALLGLARFHYFRAELDEGLTVGQQCVTLAQGAADPLPLLTDSVMAYLCLNHGDYLSARTYAERGVFAYSAERHGSIALAYGDDPGVMCQAFLSTALWFLGYPDKGRTHVAACLELARRVGIPYCEAIGLTMATWFQLFTRDVAGAAASLTALEALATQHGFPFPLAQSVGLRGARRGRGVLRGGHRDRTAPSR
jgi:hypothetical protein